MLANIGPVQIMVLMAVLLVLFGPQKLPELGQQLGRALRDLMRAKQDFLDSMKFDDDERVKPYEPPRYDTYDNPYTGSYTSTDTENTWSSNYDEPSAQLNAEPPRVGDFAAPALADSFGEEYGVSSAPAAPTAPSAAPPDGASDFTQTQPEGTVARNGVGVS